MVHVTRPNRPVTPMAGTFLTLKWRDMMSENQEQTGDQAAPRLLILLPWTVSILFHIGVVLLALFVVWSTLNRPGRDDEPVVIPDITMSDWPEQRLPTVRERRAVTPRPQRSKPPSPRSQERPRMPGSVGVGVPHVVSAVSGDPFGIGPVGPGDNDRVEMIGIPGNARQIAYVIDASGSLLDSMPFVINELKRSIGRLKDQQSFTVIFAQGGHAIEVPPRGLKKADFDHRQQAWDWIDLDSGNVIPRGSSDPVVAIKKAMQYKPQLIYLLSDNITGQGRYETDQQRLLAQISKANTTKTKINAIQFLYPDPLVKVGLQSTMKLISQRTGGVYKFIDGRELGIHW